VIHLNAGIVGAAEHVSAPAVTENWVVFSAVAPSAPAGTNAATAHASTAPGTSNLRRCVRTNDILIPFPS
jgi:hypothetical protein